MRTHQNSRLHTTHIRHQPPKWKEARSLPILKKQPTTPKLSNNQHVMKHKLSAGTNSSPAASYQFGMQAPKDRTNIIQRRTVRGPKLGPRCHGRTCRKRQPFNALKGRPEAPSLMQRLARHLRWHAPNGSGRRPPTRGAQHSPRTAQWTLFENLVSRLIPQIATFKHESSDDGMSGGTRRGTRTSRPFQRVVALHAATCLQHGRHSALDVLVQYKNTRPVRFGGTCSPQRYGCRPSTAAPGKTCAPQFASAQQPVHADL